MSDHYVTVNDFLAYDKQLMGKLGRIGEAVTDVRDQVHHLSAAFGAYRAETDAFRIQTHQQLEGLQRDLSDFKQTVTHNFALLFAHLGIART